MEALLFCISFGCVWGFLHIAYFRVWGDVSALALVLAAAFAWLFLGDLAFYLGNPQFISWPMRPLVFRGTVCAGVWLWIWFAKRKRGVTC